MWKHEWYTVVLQVKSSFNQDEHWNILKQLFQTTQPSIQIRRILRSSAAKLGPGQCSCRSSRSYSRNPHVGIPGESLELSLKEVGSKFPMQICSTNGQNFRNVPMKKGTVLKEIRSNSLLKVLQTGFCCCASAPLIWLQDFPCMASSGLTKICWHQLPKDSALMPTTSDVPKFWLVG